MEDHLQEQAGKHLLVLMKVFKEHEALKVRVAELEKQVG